MLIKAVNVWKAASYQGHMNTQEGTQCCKRAKFKHGLKILNVMSADAVHVPPISHIMCMCAVLHVFEYLGATHPVP